MTADLARASIVIRPATPDDTPTLTRLALLEGASALRGSIHVAESDGEVLAAHSLEERRTIADPFKPTAALVDLLETRAALLQGELRRPRLRRLLTKGLAVAA